MSMKMPDKKDRNIALVIVDVQRKFTGGNISETDCEQCVKIINEAADMFRRNERPTIFVHYDGPCHYSTYSNDDGDEYLHGIISDPSDIKVHKAHMNSFKETRLAEAVIGCGCDSILIAGMVTHLCILGTYYGAFDHNISPYLLEGGTITSSEKYNEAAYSLCKTFTLDDVEENLTRKKIECPANMRGREYQRCIDRTGFRSTE